MTNARVSLLGALVLAAAGVAGCFGKSSGSAGNGTQCTVNLECPSDQFCVSGVCALPGTTSKGRRCTATRDCAAGLYCNAASVCDTGGAANEGASCAADAICKPPLRCNFTGFFGTCGAAGDAELGADCQASKDCLAGLVCGPAKTCSPTHEAFPPFEGAACKDEGPYRIYFEVPRAAKPPKDFFRLPFPNDARVTDGRLDISDFPRPGPTPLGVDLVQLYVDTWTEDFDGFSTIGVTTFRFSGDIDYATSTGENVWIVDVTPGASNGRQYPREWLFSPGRTKYSCEHRMTVRNGTDSPFPAGHTIAVILTTGIKSTTGEAPTVEPDMAALLADAAPADATLMNAWTRYAPLRAWLKSPGDGVTAPTVAAAAVFRVQDAPGHMQRLAVAVEKENGPVFKDVTVCAAGVKSPCDDGTPARACGAPDPAFTEIHGRFSVPIFQKGTAPYATPEDGGGIVEQAGVPKVQRTEDVCFAMTVPKGTAPAAGWPFTVYHHGTGGSMRSFIEDGTAAKLAGAKTPSVVFGFDGVEHGARRGASTTKPDDLVFNPLNPRAARDNFLQGAVDVLQALRVAEQGGVTLADKTTIVVSSSKVAYFGHSQGSTSGALAVAVSDAAPAAVFSGAGAFLTRSLLDKTSPVNIAAGMVYLLGEPLDADHPVLTLFQSFFDRSDPLNYNPHIIREPLAGLKPKHVWMSWGGMDTYTPASTLNANGRSLGLSPVGKTPEGYGTEVIARPVTANLTSNDGMKRTAAMFVYDPSGYDGHFVATKNPAAIADWSAFLESYLATGTPVVP